MDMKTGLGWVDEEEPSTTRRLLQLTDILMTHAMKRHVRRL